VAAIPKIIKWKLVEAMLNSCAPGHIVKDKTHRRWVTWKGRTSAILPLGPHGKRENPEIQTGKVRTLIWGLEIPRDCAERVLEFPIPERL